MTDDARLRRVLEASQAAGFLGPGDPAEHIDHAEAFVGALEDALPAEPESAVDLGSGGGVPGLVLAFRHWPSTSWKLIDGAARRTEFLSWAVAELGLRDRVDVVRARAEVAGRDPDMRQHHQLVVARSFASPPVTVECAAPLLRSGGWLVVSEPPGPMRPGRWPTEPLAELGLALHRHVAGPPAIVVLRQVTTVGERWPRREGQPAKRPIYPVD